MNNTDQRRDRMRKLPYILLLSGLVAAATIALCACGTADDSVTMYVGLGNVRTGYYEYIQKQVKEKYDIDVEFVYSNTMDTSNAMVNKIKNNDLPADIIITASKTDNEYCSESMLDLAAYTNLPDNFNSAEIEKLADEDGGVYQLPYSSRLIGIGYNETLMEEMGWELPNNFEEMVELKAKADAAGIKFAVSGGCATGHGFNYLMNVMGTEFFSVPAGAEWLSEYQAGEAEVDEFADEAEYFERYVEEGLLGNLHDADWNSSTEFCQTRALFNYNNTNDAYSYDGYQYNEDGTIKGATYVDGKPTAEKSSEGEAVIIDGEYVYYDKNNEEHQGLDRYTIPGAVILHDEYASMPWISEDGSTNCYVLFNNMYVGLNKALLEDEDRLENAVQVMDYMGSKEATDYYSTIYEDGYVATNDYVIDETRLYYKYKTAVENGYRMPWYYNYFDANSVVSVGEKVNSYIRGDAGSGISAIISELDKCNTANLKNTGDVLTEMSETLGYEENARLQAESNALAADAVLEAAGTDETVDVALLPYIEAVSDINDDVSLPVVQEKIYKGPVIDATLSSYVSSYTNDVAIVKLSGEEINALAGDGWNSGDEFEYDHTFPVTCFSRADEEISDDETYLVAIPWQILGTGTFEKYKKDGKVIMKDGEPLKATTLDGLHLYFADRKTVSADDLKQ